MPNLKRLFTLWLLLSVLGFSTAWAFDTHAGPSGHATQVGSHEHDSAGHGDSPGCDHCCHLGFHLLGLPGGGAAPCHGGGERFLAHADPRLTAAPREPPARPPDL